MKRHVSPAQLAARLSSSGIVRHHFPYVGSVNAGLPPRPRTHGERWVTVEELASQLIGDEELAGLWLGGWLGTPQGELLEQAVGMVIPKVYRADYDLLLEALERAARQQNKRAAGLALVGAAVLGALVWLTREQ